MRPADRSDSGARPVSSALVARAAAAGVLKDTEPADVLQALRVVVRGDALLSPAVTRRLISEFVARPPDAVSAAGLDALAPGNDR